MKRRRAPPRHVHERGQPRPGPLLHAHRLPRRRRRRRPPEPRLDRLGRARPSRTTSCRTSSAIGGGSRSAPGYAGPQHAPVEVADPAAGVENLKPADSLPAFDRRAGLLDEMEQGFVDRVPGAGWPTHTRPPTSGPSALMHSAKAKAFDLSAGASAVRDAYGDTQVRRGRACWPAGWSRTACSFVEVPLGGWDTHHDNSDRVKTLCGQLDPADGRAGRPT